MFMKRGVGASGPSLRRTVHCSQSNQRRGRKRVSTECSTREGHHVKYITGAPTACHLYGHAYTHLRTTFDTLIPITREPHTKRYRHLSTHRRSHRSTTPHAHQLRPHTPTLQHSNTRTLQHSTIQRAPSLFAPHHTRADTPPLSPPSNKLKQPKPPPSPQTHIFRASSSAISVSPLSSWT